MTGHFYFLMRSEIFGLFELVRFKYFFICIEIDIGFTMGNLTISNGEKFEDS